MNCQMTNPFCLRAVEHCWAIVKRRLSVQLNEKTKDEKHQLSQDRMLVALRRVLDAYAAERPGQRMARGVRKALNVVVNG